MLKAKSLVLGSLMSALFATGAVAAELKVGFVDTQRIFKEAPAAQKALKKLDSEFSKRDQDLQKLVKQLQSMQEGLEKNAVTMSESERRTREREVAEASRDIQRKQREFREDINLRQNEENAALIEKANKAISKIAEAEKYDLILQDVVWVNHAKLDITEKVIKALSEGK